MDTELARTFLAAHGSGSFVAAAERLHVTQSTVSARIQLLEAELGCVLFTRNRAGARLTDAGRRFHKHALLLVRTVETARHDVGLPEGIRASVSVGARIGLWEGLMLGWLGEVRRALPDISMRTEIGLEADLMQGLIDGRLDIGVMYTPQRRPRLEIEMLLEERLVLVASPGPEAGARYVHVDWGPEFDAQFSASFPDAGGPMLSANIGWLGLRYLLENGGSGYFPLRLVGDLLARGTLVRIASAPDFVLPAWVVYASDRDRSVIDAMIGLLRRRVREGNAAA
ncbi:LysR family transcriptional regulator [Paralimibaculum aggregatum]|uniref:LysR family transcriptional regulator n=1 Tax=Paralimibaculum aggregatum TaxID=3036245 RepID=A0ABQ6LM62_9RHOB|nr:LysR family transcriptional regulator [Limibaculum sp. NKW23]GMG84042.1 LysR family transcriptional regulator [Limibaculum sp. NKW23]